MLTNNVHVEFGHLICTQVKNSVLSITVHLLRACVTNQTLNISLHKYRWQIWAAKYIFLLPGVSGSGDILGCSILT